MPGYLREVSGHSEKAPAASYSPTLKECSTIGSGGLNFRVRDGNGCGPSDVATGKCSACRWTTGHMYLKSGRETPRADPRAKRGRNDQAARSISTGQLSALPRVHLRPIYVVVFDGPSGGLRPGRPGLEAGFPLRCFQRLSRPYMATQRCAWRHNWCTRGTSIPVLSY